MLVQDIVLVLFLRSEKMKLNKKQLVSLTLIIGMSLLLMLFFTNIGFKNKAINRTSTQQSMAKMQYVLVNEDVGSELEGKYYALGKDFVTLINKDNENRWEMTTRNVATAGIEAGQFDALIIIPANFSEKLLSLQMIDPEKAQIEYKVSEGQNEITNQLVEQKVNGILTDFNQRIVQMYFSSIVNNLLDAQQNVNRLSTSQVNYQTDLTKSVLEPFQVIPSNYENVLSTTSLLTKDNLSFKADQQIFIEAVATLLDSNNQTLENNGQLTGETKEAITSYTQEGNDKIEALIAQFNQQFDLQKQQLLEQWSNDTTNYGNQYDHFNQTIHQQLNTFYNQSETESSVLSDFYVEANLFHENQTNRRNELLEIIEDTQQQAINLYLLKDKIARTYYNNKNSTPESFSEAEVKKAILNLLKDSTVNEPRIGDDYFNILGKNIASIPASSLSALTEELAKNNLIDSEQAERYQEELFLVEKYAQEHGIKMDTEINFSYLEASELHNQAISGGSPSISFSINTDKPTSIGIQSSDALDGDVTIEWTEDKKQEIRNQLNQQLEPYQFEVEIEYHDNEFLISAAKPIKNTGEESGDNSSNLPKLINLSLKLPIQWHLTDEQLITSFNQVNYSWYKNKSYQSSNYYSVYLPLDDPLIEDIPTILQQYQILDNSTQQLMTLFGTPNESLTHEDFFEWIQDNKDDSYETLAKSSSIYHMYGTITEEDKQVLISESLYDNFKKSGDELYINVDKQLNQVLKILGEDNQVNDEENYPTLYGLLNVMTEPEKLLTEAEKLNDWYIEASDYITQSYDEWHEETIVEAQSIINEENPHPTVTDQEPIKNQADQLVETITQLMASSKEMTETIKNSAAKVADIEPTLTELASTTTQVQESADTILSGLQASISTSNKMTEENEIYAQNFNKVLANTKQGGADNPKVFDFLSRPLVAEKEAAKVGQISLIPYYVTVMMILLPFIISLALSGLMKRRAVTEDDLLITPTISWQNIPNILLILLTTLITGSLFSFLVTQSLADSHRFSWFMYTLLIFSSLLLLLLGGIRLFKKVTIYLYGAVLGMFVMMTPLLGITIKTDSFTSLLFRISPFQNIQNGYSSLEASKAIGLKSYLFLSALIVIGIVGNLFIYPEAKRNEK